MTTSPRSITTRTTQTCDHTTSICRTPPCGSHVLHTQVNDKGVLSRIQIPTGVGIHYQPSHHNPIQCTQQLAENAPPVSTNTPSSNSYHLATSPYSNSHHFGSYHLRHYATAGIANCTYMPHTFQPCVTPLEHTFSLATFVICIANLFYSL